MQEPVARPPRRPRRRPKRAALSQGPSSPTAAPSEHAASSSPPGSSSVSVADPQLIEPTAGGRAPYRPRPLPPLVFPDELPVSAERERIAAAIRRAPVVIVAGETGSGKTTQLPKICALAGRGEAGRIGHTQPRRIAATSVSRRIAEELGTPLGTDVGFKIRFGEQLEPGARFKLMTDGILLAETQGDPSLRQYDTLIIDEAHERSLNIDFLLGYLKRLLDGPRRDDLKVVITSATIDAQRFAEHFGRDGEPAPVIEVSGRTYPVEIRYQPRGGAAPAGRDEEDEDDLPALIEQAIESLWTKSTGDVLVFLPGEREIREAAEHLGRASRTGWLGRLQPEIVPLYARLSAAEQQRVFSHSNGRRIVLATNVAETSLTVPGIRFVVDSGLARVKRYRVRGKVEQLQVEPVSRAAADQRAGRCGRVANGICVRLYDEADYAARPRFTDPEILRSSLAAVILRMKSLRLGAVEDYPFLDQPTRGAITDGHALLQELGAIDEDRAITPVGWQLARLPVDPRVGRMLLAAHRDACLDEVLTIAAYLSSQDPRERPLAAQQAADQSHAEFSDARSDFLGIIKLWQWWRTQLEGRAAAGESRAALSRRLERRFLSPRRLREWADVREQLAQACRELQWSTGASPPARPDDVHRALLTGLLGNLGFRAADARDYQGTHQTRFAIHPSSALARKAPRWLMAAEMVDTARLFARTVAGVQPEWIEQAASHRLQRSRSDPVWSRKAGQAVVHERGVLYGLVVYAQRRVPLAPTDPALAREMFIRHALVEGDWVASERDDPPAFIAHNRRLVESIEKLEQQIRRPDLLADAQFIFEWFDARVPAEVTGARSFERWYERAVRDDERLLCLTREELLRKDAEGVTSADFPREIMMRGARFSLEYRFEPGAPDDGVTMTVPLSLLNQVDAERCEWLVPGLLADKVQALCKSLPQRLRRHLVPLPAWAAAFARRHPQAPSLPLIDAIRADARAHGAVQLAVGDFRPDTLPTHLAMNFRIVDAHGVPRAESRQLAQLRAQFGDEARGAFREAFAVVAAQLQPATAGERVEASPGEQSGLVASSESVIDGPSDTATGEPDRVHDGVDAMGAAPPALVLGERFRRWPVDELPDLLEITDPASGTTLVGFPAFVDRDDSASIEIFDDQDEARARHRAGVRRLLAIALREPLKSFHRGVPDFHRLALGFARMGDEDALRAQLTDAMLVRAVGDAAEPASRAAFDRLASEVRTRLSLIGQTLVSQLQAVLEELGAVQRKLQSARPAAAREPAVRITIEDIEAQIARLLPAGFLRDTPAEAFAHFPRYLKSMLLRLERMRADPARDARQRADLAQLWSAYERLRRERRGRIDPELDRLRWLIEELHVSLFAPGLRTPSPVSVKRLQRAIQALSG